MARRPEHSRPDFISGLPVPVRQHCLNGLSAILAPNELSVSLKATRTPRLTPSGSGRRPRGSDQYWDWVPPRRFDARAESATSRPPLSSLLFIENVGNLVCPALFDLGERAKVVLISVTEGDDKPLKYPHIFRESEVMILNKVDLLPYVPFDLDRCLIMRDR